MHRNEWWMNFAFTCTKRFGDIWSNLKYFEKKQSIANIPSMSSHACVSRRGQRFFSVTLSSQNKSSPHDMFGQIFCANSSKASDSQTVAVDCRNKRTLPGRNGEPDMPIFAAKAGEMIFIFDLNYLLVFHHIPTVPFVTDDRWSVFALWYLFRPPIRIVYIYIHNKINNFGFAGVFCVWNSAKMCAILLERRGFTRVTGAHTVWECL